MKAKTVTIKLDVETIPDDLYCFLRQAFIKEYEISKYFILKDKPTQYEDLHDITWTLTCTGIDMLSKDINE